MTNIALLRHQICLAIGSLKSEGDDVESKLKPLLDQAAVELVRTSPADATASSSSSSSSSLSPLLVASDKGHVASLVCLSRYDTAIVGGPLDASLEEKQDGGSTMNTPVHHAAMAGCSEAWEIFADMMLRVVSNNSQTKKQSKESIYETLASVTNAHGDTPLQMAVPVGHLGFLQKWYTLATATAISTKTIQTILQMTNQAGDTCASLACCHGHVHLVDFLLNTCHVSISHDEITKCQATVRRMDHAVQTTAVFKDPIARASFFNRQAQVHDCLKKLQAAVSQQADDAAIELLLLEGADNDTMPGASTTTTSSHNIACSFKKSKKKKKGNKGNSQKASITSCSKDSQKASPLGASTNSASSARQEEPFHVTRLRDGRVAVSVPGENVFTDKTGGNNIHEDESWPLLATTTTTTTRTNDSRTTPSAEILLRHRFRRRRRRSEGDVANDSSSHHEEHDDDIDAVMDALCLDVSMLLYTPHGMALNLSPSQLDAVQQILEMQIRSVHQARSLQQCRMMHPPPPPTATAISTTTATTTAIELMNNHQETAAPATAKG
jgi:hypothetical protein